jgi:hypothetical protein
MLLNRAMYEPLELSGFSGFCLPQNFNHPQIETTDEAFKELSATRKTITHMLR